MKKTRLVILVAAAACLGACGPDAPEQRLAEAREQLRAARARVETLEERVEEKREKVRRAEQVLADAREELERAESDLAGARREIDQQATDVALFRAVQRALLESEPLEGYAIGVQVRDGVVTLRGTVDEPGQVEVARRIAREQAGVDGVESEIRVRDPAAKPGRG